MVRSASCASRTVAFSGGARCHPSRRAQMRAPQDEVFFFFGVFFFEVFFLAAAGFFLVAAFAAFAALRAFGRLPRAARCAAAKAASPNPSALPDRHTAAPAVASTSPP